MIAVLYVIGALYFVFSLVAGFTSGHLFSFLAGGIASTTIFFALAIVLTNQNDIILKLQYQDEVIRKLQNSDKKVCSQCSYNYDSDYSSCPHCGHRDKNTIR